MANTFGNPSLFRISTGIERALARYFWQRDQSTSRRRSASGSGAPSGGIWHVPTMSATGAARSAASVSKSWFAMPSFA